jgi:hypothetical protein
MSELWLNDTVMIPLKTNTLETDSLILPNLSNDLFVDNYLMWDNETGKVSYSTTGGQQGPAGPAGPAGPQGPQGPAGSGSGNVQGPGSSSIDGIVTFNTTNGTLIKSNGIKIISNGEAFQFPPNSGGDVMDFFKYYVSNVTFVTQAPPTTTILTSCPVKALRVGHMVTITVGPRTSTNGSNGVVGNYITEFVDYLPVEFRPRTTTTSYCRVIDRDFICLGNLKIDTTGKMTLDVAKVSASFVTDQGFLSFSAGEKAGIFETATLSYFII